VATLIAAGPGAAGRARLIYRTHVDREHSTHRREGFTEVDYGPPAGRRPSGAQPRGLTTTSTRQERPSLRAGRVAPKRLKVKYQPS
jgi:hypothetical protein